MLKWLLKSLLITAVFVPLATALPVASLWLCRDPVGGQIVFWCGPWSCAFWSILAYNLIGSKFWRGREAVGMAIASRRVSVLGRQGHRVDVRFPVLLLRLRGRSAVGDA